jgi:hypothetical protein
MLVFGLETPTEVLFFDVSQHRQWTTRSDWRQRWFSDESFLCSSDTIDEEDLTAESMNMLVRTLEGET